MMDLESHRAFGTMHSRPVPDDTVQAMLRQVFQTTEEVFEALVGMRNAPPPTEEMEPVEWRGDKGTGKTLIIPRGISLTAADESTGWLTVSKWTIEHYQRTRPNGETSQRAAPCLGSITRQAVEVVYVMTATLDAGVTEDVSAIGAILSSEGEGRAATDIKVASGLEAWDQAVITLDDERHSQVAPNATIFYACVREYAALLRDVQREIENINEGEPEAEPRHRAQLALVPD